VTGPELTMHLRALLGDLVGVYTDPELGPAATRPAISYGALPASVVATGLEAHVDDTPELESSPLYRHELTIERAWLVYLVEHDGTPPGRLQSATERVLAAFRTSSPSRLPGDERLGIRNQVLVRITDR
jgi:hypothetical protein